MKKHTLTKRERERERERDDIHIMWWKGGAQRHFQLPPFNFLVSFVISNASHMLGHIKLKVSTKESKREISHIWKYGSED